jgi:hypothetical protein
VKSTSVLRKSFVADLVKRVRFGGINVAARPAGADEEEKDMRLLRAVLRPVIAIVLMVLALSPAVAQDETAPVEVETPWQETITGQIQAFRDQDAPVAFSYAGASFQAAFPSAEAFFTAIVTSGYAPIMQSVSHSFGGYRLIGPVGVVQEVRFVGEDQELYGAIYQLTEEDAGWRVQGVQLFRQAGVAI